MAPKKILPKIMKNWTVIMILQDMNKSAEILKVGIAQ